MLKSIILIAFIALSLGKAINPKKVVYAVDCGNMNPNGMRSSQGIYYQADQGYSRNSKVADYNINEEISGATLRYTNDQPVYMTERHADESFSYEIPVNAPGKYVLILKFTEVYFKAARKRVFNIKFGDTRIVDEIDIFAEVGKNAAYDEYIEFELTSDNQILSKGRRCNNAIKGGKLLVEFEKIGLDNPKVDGIVLFQGTLDDTDYSEIPAMRQEWDKRIQEELKKKEELKNRLEEARQKRKEKVKVRNDEFEDFVDEIEDGYVHQEKTGTSPLYIIGAIVLIGGYLFQSSGKSTADVQVIENLDDYDEVDNKKAENKDKKKSKKNK